MTNATMDRNFNPGRSPLLGIAAVAAAAVTMGIAVLLPTQLAPSQVARMQAPAVVAAPEAVAVAAVEAPLQVAVEAPLQVVRLPAVDVTATRPAKAASNRYNMPAVYKQKS